MLPRQLHRKPTEAGAKFRSLLSKAHHGLLLLLFFEPFYVKLLSWQPDIPLWCAHSNRLTWDHLTPPGTKGFRIFYSFSENHCWLTPICWWSASGSSSSTSALYSSNASSSTSGSPSNYKEEKILCNSELHSCSFAANLHTNPTCTSQKPQTLE